MSTDCIVIGGGHNGLACAAYLARSGRSVLVLESSADVGGAAATREFAPGFKVSAGAHLLHMMPATLIAELGLEKQGLVYAALSMGTVSLSPERAPLALDPAGLAAGSAPDAAAYADFAARMRRFAAALLPLLNAPPPRLGTGQLTDKLNLLRLGWQIRKLGRRDMRELLRIAGMNAYDLLEEHFHSAALKGMLGLDATLGTNFGPRTPGTVLSLLYRMACEGAANHQMMQVQGGMGALCGALAASARASGAVIRTGARVTKITVLNDKASGVVLSDGEEITAGTVISSADPKTTFLALLGTRHLDTGFVRRITHLRNRGLAAKLHLALDRMPDFTGVTASQGAGRLVIAPSLDHIERAYNHSKYGEFSSAPVFEITVPTASDASLAPAGKHVLSAVVQYAPYDVKGGWAASRQKFAELAIHSLDRHAPGLAASVVAQELLTPADIEREFNIAGGHWHHAEFAFDQFLMVRPVPGAAQYATPVTGLFLCGAGSHPGGGVTGIPGRNAARRIITGGQ